MSLTHVSAVCTDVAQISDMMTEDMLKHINEDEDGEKQKEDGEDTAGEARSEMEGISGDYIIC